MFEYLYFKLLLIFVLLKYVVYVVTNVSEAGIGIGK